MKCEAFRIELGTLTVGIFAVTVLKEDKSDNELLRAETTGSFIGHIEVA